MGAKKGFELGDDIDIYCRWCGLNMNAVVSALDDGGGIAKVQCRTCRNFLPYKAPKDMAAEKRKLMEKALKLRDKRGGGSAASKKAKRKEPESLAPEAVARRMWDEATKDANPLKSKIYRPELTFGNGDLITVPKLGLGVVSEVGDDHVLVLFRHGIERLEHNLPPEDDR